MDKIEWANIALQNADVLGTVALTYFLIQALRRWIPADIKPIAAIAVCVGLTLFNPVREWEIFLRVVYGALMGGAAIVAHVLARTALRLALRKLYGDRDGDAELQRIIDDVRAEHRTSRGISPPKAGEHVLRKLEKVIT